MKETRYLVIDRRENGEGDEFIEVYETLSEANQAAETAWDYLTKSERINRRIIVGIVTTEDLADWAIDDDGSVNWEAYEQYDTNGDCFNSDRM